MRRLTEILLLALLVAMIPALASAESPWAEQEGYANRAGGKFAFGLENTALGWTELFSEPIESGKQKENVAAGFGRGLFNTIADTVGGALHLATFPFTTIDIPLPQNGTQIMVKNK